jgi:hypothetical protein
MPVGTKSGTPMKNATEMAACGGTFYCCLKGGGGLPCAVLARSVAVALVRPVGVFMRAEMVVLVRLLAWNEFALDGYVGNPEVMG